MRERIETLIRSRREKRVAKLTQIIEKETVLLNGIDEDLWPHDVQQSRERRVRAWHERRALLAKLPKETHVRA
jgi:hypothetical protein